MGLGCINGSEDRFSYICTPKHVCFNQEDVMNNKLELAIRTGYSSILPNLEALSLWVSNTLSELCFHDELIFDFTIRTKTVESLLKKVDGLINREGAKIHNFDDVRDVVNDFVGSRIMVYTPKILLGVHMDPDVFSEN